MTINIRVTQERFEEVVSIDDEMHFGEMTKKEVYDYMVQFVMNGDNSYLPVDEARKLFKKIPSKELNGYITKFFKAVSEAYVSPQNAGISEGQSSQKSEPLPNG